MFKKALPIAVLGGGVSGLAAALELSENGEKVVLLEKDRVVGGAARSISIPEKREIPAGYHHIVFSDSFLLNYLDKFNLTKSVRWKNTRISILVDGKKMDLASPADVLKFKDLPLASRIKYMLFGARCIFKKSWDNWEGKTVSQLLNAWADENVLKTIFDPLVDVKFGISADIADAAWLGRRLSHREGNIPFGSIPNASWTQKLCDEFVKRIKKLNGEILTKKEVTAIKVDAKNKVTNIFTNDGKRIDVKAVISTLPPPALSKAGEANFPKPWIRKLEKIKYISCYSLNAGFKTKFFDDYWTIFLKPRRVFGACFTLSLLNESLVTKKDKSVVNLFTNVPYGKYLYTPEGYTKKALKEFNEETGNSVKPNWAKTTIIQFVSPVFSVGYKNLPDRLGPNLFLAGVYNTYPKFSSTGEAMENGRIVAGKLLESL